MWFKKKGATRCHIQPGITCNGDCKNCDTWKEHQAPYKMVPNGAEWGEIKKHWEKHRTEYAKGNIPEEVWRPRIILREIKVDKQEPMGYNTPIPECWLKMDKED